MLYKYVNKWINVLYVVLTFSSLAKCPRMHFITRGNEWFPPPKNIIILQHCIVERRPLL